jgi:hypothetical protein
MYIKIKDLKAFDLTSIESLCSSIKREILPRIPLIYTYYAEGKALGLSAHGNINEGLIIPISSCRVFKESLIQAFNEHTKVKGKIPSALRKLFGQIEEIPPGMLQIRKNILMPIVTGDVFSDMVRRAEANAPYFLELHRLYTAEADSYLSNYAQPIQFFSDVGAVCELDIRFDDNCVFVKHGKLKDVVTLGAYKCALI